MDNKFISNLGFTTLAKILIAGLGFGTQVLLSRLLSKSEFGLISTLVAFGSYFALLADYSTSSIAQTNILKEMNKAEEHYHIYVTTKAITTLGALVLFIILAFLLGYASNKLILSFMAISIPLTALIIMPQVLLLAFSKFKIYSALLLTTSVINFVFQGFGLWLKPSKENYFFFLILGNIIAVLINYWIIGKQLPIIFKWKKASGKQIWILVCKSTPLLMGSFSYLLFYRANSILLEKMSGSETVAEYNLAWMIGNNVVELVWVQFILIFYPKMVELFQTDRNRLIVQLRKVSLFFFGFFFASILITHFIGEWIFTLIFGSKYGHAAIVFELMLPSLFLTIIFALYYRLLIILGRQTVYLTLMVSGSIINLGIGMIVIRKYGSFGALGANFTAQLIVSILIYYFSVRYTRKNLT